VADADYVLTAGTGITDLFGGALPTAYTLSFTAGTSTPTADAGPMVDAM
jgi:hypothetical protein